MKHDKAVVLGITGSWAFAAGSLLQALTRHNPDLDSDILVFHDASLAEADRLILEGLGARCRIFQSEFQDVRIEALNLYSPLCLAKLSCFELLRHYRAVLWLDSDIIIQDSIAGVWEHGPFGLALEDGEFAQDGALSLAGINVVEKTDWLDSEARNLNSGVMVLGGDLLDFWRPEDFYAFFHGFLAANAAVLRYPDQAALNALAQKIGALKPALLAALPVKFNCHPRNRLAVYAPIVHAFGAYKLWNDGLTAACFPEWQRDYARWLSLGGSPYSGPVENAEYGGAGAFHLLGGLFETIGRSEKTILALEGKLRSEIAAREKFEKIVAKMASAKRSASQ